MGAQQQKVIPITGSRQTLSTSPREGEGMLHHGRVAAEVMGDASISGLARCLYGLLTTFANKNLQCRVSRARLAEKMGYSARSVSKWLRELEDRGVIQRTHTTGPVPVYTLAANRVEVNNEPLNEASRGVERTFKGGGTYVQGGLNEASRGVERGFNRISDSSVDLSGKDQCESQSAPAKSTGGSEAPNTLPRGVVIGPNGEPRLEPIATNTEGKAVFGSDALLYVTKHIHGITTDAYDMPLRAWIETHFDQIPRSHDVQRCVKTADAFSAEELTTAIRKMGDAGKLKFDHVYDYLKGGGK